jgi:hypothetical protein
MSSRSSEPFATHMVIGISRPAGILEMALDRLVTITWAIGASATGRSVNTAPLTSLKNVDTKCCTGSFTEYSVVPLLEDTWWMLAQASQD